MTTMSLATGTAFIVYAVPVTLCISGHPLGGDGVLLAGLTNNQQKRPKTRSEVRPPLIYSTLNPQCRDLSTFRFSGRGEMTSKSTVRAIQRCSQSFRIGEHTTHEGPVWGKRALLRRSKQFARYWFTSAFGHTGPTQIQIKHNGGTN